MTKLLDEAIARVRELPESEQDDAAEILLSLAAKRSQPIRLDEETRAAVREGQAQARRGEFASDEDVARVYKRRV